jgi:ribulose-phosphate 3-epimerase
MDGHFVPNLSFGPPVIECLRKNQKDAYIDCHLMVSEPAKWVEPLRKAGASSFTFHIESIMPGSNEPVAGEISVDGVRALIRMIRDAGMKVGVTLRPSTSVDTILPYLGEVDLALIMTVNPGFSGQKFMPEMMEKIKTIRSKHPTLPIQVDGGVSPSTIDMAAEAGANVIVAASAIFGAEDRKHVIQQLRAGVEKYNQ